MTADPLPLRTAASEAGPPGGPWAGMSALLGPSLIAHGLVPDAAGISLLGVRDELSVPADESVPPSGEQPVAIHLYGHHAVVGPLPRPGSDDPGCPRCLARRWQAVRSFSLRDALEQGGETAAAGPSPYRVPFAADTLAALIAAHLERRGGPGGSALPGTGDGAREGSAEASGSAALPEICLVDLERLTVRSYPLVPDPECPACGRSVPDTAEGARLTLSAAPKHAPGSFRLRGIDDYDLDVDAFANPVCGALGPSVVHDVASRTTSATVGCFTLRSGDYLRETFWGGHADSFRRSTRIGVLEGLERAAGMRPRAKRTEVVASLNALGDRARVDPRECGLYSDAFHRDNPQVKPFSPDREIPWVWGWSLRDEQPVLVPEVLTYYHAPGGLENRFVQESSNGCASGGCLEEALYFGLMEVVERDAFLLSWYGQARLPEIDPRTSARPATRRMVDRLAMYGYEARFFDTRITFPIPVVTAVAVRRDRGMGTLCFGAGAGLDPESALDSALCEIATDAANLVDRTLQSEARLRRMAADFDRVEVLHDHPLLYGLPEMARYADFLLAEPGGPSRPRRSMADLYGNGSVPPVSTDLRDDVRQCVSWVTGAGYDVVAVDQTLPEQRDLGLHTVGVIVPGLIPIDFGRRRQRAPHMPRMRTALREAGLRDHDLAPEEVNPAPHPFP